MIELRIPERKITKEGYQSDVRGMIGRGRPPMPGESKIAQYLKERVG